MVAFGVSTMTPSDLVKQELEKNAEKIDKYIFALLKTKRPEVLYEASMHIIKGGGKRLRPYLVLKSCEIVGGEADDAIPFAAAMEVFHNFTLIHDDIMDNDDMRRGVPTVHAKYGIPVAIVSGDLLFAKVYETIALSDKHEVPCDSVRACVELVSKAAVDLCEGQVLDTSFPYTTNVSEEDYIFMVERKTAALFRACAEVGGIVGGGNQKDVERLGEFAWNSGIAFQIVDDILGLTGDEATLGKPVGSDLREGKKTLIIIHALSHASTRNREAIERVLGNERASPKAIKSALKVLRDLESFDYALKCAKGYAEQAKSKLSPFSESEAKRSLLELVDYYVERTY